MSQVLLQTASYIFQEIIELAAAEDPWYCI